MDALILAAGYGSRLHSLSGSKPLTPICGFALLELGVLQAARAGASRIVVVTGHRAEDVEARLPEFAAKADVPIVAERLSDWSLPNGYSVMAGATRISGNYLLMMADHIFSRSILCNLAMQGAADRGITLAIDRHVTNPLVDPDDATWVNMGEGGFIHSIGKNIPDYNAVDCGAFLATSELAPAIAAAIADGLPGSLSDGVQRLADAGRAATMDIGGAWWLDVDDPRAHALAEAQAAFHLPEIYADAAALPPLQRVLA